MRKSIHRAGFFSIALIGITLAACNSKFNSAAEARYACNEWEKQGDSVTFSYVQTFEAYGSKRQGTYQKTLNERECILEKETRQYLGYQGKIVNIKEGEVTTWEAILGEAEDRPRPRVADNRVVKNFYY